jgi:hypothetical protein
VLISVLAYMLYYEKYSRQCNKYAYVKVLSLKFLMKSLSLVLGDNFYKFIKSKNQNTQKKKKNENDWRN